MNAERLHAILVVLQREMTEEDLSTKMQNMVRSLEAVVNQSNSMTQQNLASSLEALYAALGANESDNFSPTWRQVLCEIGGENLLGSRLREYVQATITRNQLTPAVALNELKGGLEQLQRFEGAVDSAVSAFQEFDIGDEKLQPGECEVAVLVPRQAVENQLIRFSEELRDLGFIMNNFSEVATGTPSELEIKAISSSGLMVFLDAAAPYAACLAVALERVVALYKQLLEIRKLHKELRGQGVPEEETMGVVKYANELMERGIDKAAKEVVEEFYHGNDKGRKNELTVGVRLSMNRIANRIDNGFNFEVRVQPFAEEEVDQGEDLRKAVARIQAATPSMQFLKLEGKPLLKLPEAGVKPKKKGGRDESG